MADPRKWKKFERLVAAIHVAADEGAQVTWDERIGSRQFDVTIRFERGLYKYLTVIECKDYSRPVSVDKVDAFVTKCHDVGANFGVLASSSGFQEGAETVAKKHNITLLHIIDTGKISSLPFGAKIDGETDALHIDMVSIEYSDGEQITLPGESNALRYYVNHTIINIGDVQKSLQNMICEHIANIPIEEYETFSIDCPDGASVVAPNDGEVRLEAIKSIHFRAGMIKAKMMHGPAIFDPYLLSPDIKIVNISSGDERIIPQAGLPFGFDTTPEIGKFYENKNLSIFYYCANINGDLITWYLIESYQHGQIIQGNFTQLKQYSKYYVEVTDTITLQRLRGRLNALLDKMKRSGK